MGNQECANFKEYQDRLGVTQDSWMVVKDINEKESGQNQATSIESFSDNTRVEEEHCLVDGFILCLESLLKKILHNAQEMNKVAIMINMLINNPKVSFHGKSILSLYRVAFALSQPKENSPPESPVKDPFNKPVSKPRTVDNYINYLVSKCERSLYMPLQRKRLSSFEAQEKSQALFRSLAVAPQQQVVHGGSMAAFLYEDSSDLLKSSVEQDSRLTAAPEDQVLTYLHKSMSLLVDQAELYHEKSRQLCKSLSRSGQPATESVIAASVPVFSVPRAGETNLALYAKTFKISQVNEKAATAGLFGWCFMCRGTADFFCKDSRLPVCGKKCKESLLQFISIFNLPRKRR